MFLKNSVELVLFCMWNHANIQADGTSFRKKGIGGPGCGALSSAISRRSPQVFNPDPSFNLTSYIPIIIPMRRFCLPNASNEQLRRDFGKYIWTGF